MLADERAAELWAREWADVALVGGAVEWETRSWHSIGRQRVPVRLVLSDGDDIAAFAAGEAENEWRRLRGRVDQLRELVDLRGDTEHVALDAAVRSSGELLLRYDDQEFADVLAATLWLSENSVEGLRPRQLPIRGVDSKWFTSHRGILSALHRALTGAEALGIVDNDPLLRLRVLDPAISAGGLPEYAAPVGVVAALAYAPRAVFVFENLESVLALPEWKDAIAVHGSGYAVDVVGTLPWVQAAPVVYWGDLDSNGFAILHRLRLHHPHVVSVLMDEDTLVAHRDLWVREPTPNRGLFDTLTGSERRALQRLRDEGDVRLEQERIGWDTALRGLKETWSALG